METRWAENFARLTGLLYPSTHIHMQKLGYDDLFAYTFAHLMYKLAANTISRRMASDASSILR